MARPKTLAPGGCYFLVNYHDADLLFPCIDTLVYLRNEDSAEGRRWLFQQPAFPKPDGTKGVADAPVVVFTDDQLHMVLDFSGLLRTLSAVAGDQTARPVDSGASTLAEGGPQFGDLPKQLATFLDRPAYASLRIRIRFTDDGIALLRLPAGDIQMMFFLRPRLEPDREPKVRALFSSLGLKPCEDYVADSGRTRDLAFPMPQDPEAIVRLCVRVFRETFVMESDDTLEFAFSS